MKLNYCLFAVFATVAHLAASSVFAQSIRTKPANDPGLTCDTIPITLVEGQIVMDILINDHPAKVLFDTGSGPCFFNSNADGKYGFEVSKAGSRISGTSGGSGMVNQLKVPGITIGKHLKISNPEAMELNSPAFGNMGVVGIVGSGVFLKSAVSVDLRNNRMLVYTPGHIGSIMNAKPYKMTNIWKKTPYFGMPVGDTTIVVMVDTGCNLSLYLNRKDSELLRAHAGADSVALMIGSTGMGIGGADNVKAVYTRVNNIKIGDGVFNNVKGVIKGNKESLIGIPFLHYGVFTFDYRAFTLYFEPYDTAPVDMEKVSSCWNAMLVDKPKDDESEHVVVSGILGDVDLKLGERIWSINEVDINDVMKEHWNIFLYMENMKNDTATITVGRDRDNTRKVEIRRI